MEWNNAISQTVGRSQDGRKKEVYSSCLMTTTTLNGCFLHRGLDRIYRLPRSRF